nr:hypothetical protein [uncultured Acetatifactor sp.]
MGFCIQGSDYDRETEVKGGGDGLGHEAVKMAGKMSKSSCRNPQERV